MRSDFLQNISKVFDKTFFKKFSVSKGGAFVAVRRQRNTRCVRKTQEG